MKNPEELAATGLAQIKTAILLYLEQHPDGAKNSAVATDLGLRSGLKGLHKNYLTWSILDLMVDEGLVRVQMDARVKHYFKV